MGNSTTAKDNVCFNGIIGRIYLQAISYDEKTKELVLANIMHEVNPNTGSETGKVEVLDKFILKAEHKFIKSK